MRVALFTDTFYPQVNGVARTIERTALLLARAGHEVRVYAPSSDPAAAKGCGGEAYAVEILPSISSGIYKGERIAFPTGAALRAMRENPPDLIHSHTPFGAGLAAVRAARRLQVPLVGTHHTFFDHYLKHIGLDYAPVRRATWSYTAWYYNRCDLVLSPTRALLSAMEGSGLKRPSEVVPNPADTALFAPPTAAQKREAKKMLGIAGPAALYLGRLSYEKSVDQALRAFTFAAAREPRLSFIMAGDGPERGRLEALAAALGVAHRVRFTGFAGGEALLAALHAADVSISASKSENMPLAVLESLAAGLPVVAVSSLGMRELVEDGVNGFLCEPDKPEDLAGRLLSLVSDESLRAEFSARARASAMRFDPARVAVALLGAYARARGFSG